MEKEVRKPILWERVKNRGYRQLEECETVEQAEQSVAAYRMSGRDVLWSYVQPKQLV